MENGSARSDAKNDILFRLIKREVNLKLLCEFKLFIFALTWLWLTTSFHSHLKWTSFNEQISYLYFQVFLLKLFASLLVLCQRNISYAISSIHAIPNTQYLGRFVRFLGEFVQTAVIVECIEYSVVFHLGREKCERKPMETAARKQGEI